MAATKDTKTRAKLKASAIRLRTAGKLPVEIARSLKVAPSTVTRWLQSLDGIPPLKGPKVKRTKKPGAPKPTEPELPELETIDDTGGPLSHDELRTLLSKQIRSLERQLRKANTDGDVRGAASARRLIGQLAPLVGRLTPRPPDDDHDTVRVTKGQMDTAAEETRTQLHQIVEAAEREQATWPKCPSCGRPAMPRGYLDVVKRSPAGHWARLFVEVASNVQEAPSQP